MNVAKESQGDLSEGQKVSKSLKETECKHMKYLMVNAYGVMKKGRPTSFLSLTRQKTLTLAALISIQKAVQLLVV